MLMSALCPSLQLMHQVACHYVGSISQSDAIKITTNIGSPHVFVVYMLLLKKMAPILQTSDKSLQKIKDSAEKWRVFRWL